MPEGGVNKGWQTVLRSRNIYGPYEQRQVLLPRSPHQVALIQLANGHRWFLGFKSAGFLGRITHLMPATWRADDWPVFGDEGHTVRQWRKPDVGRTYPIRHPQRSDDFNGRTLSPAW